MQRVPNKCNGNKLHKGVAKKYPGQVRRIERGGVDVSIELAF
jgi:hypothetical protein